MSAAVQHTPSPARAISDPTRLVVLLDRLLRLNWARQQRSLQRYVVGVQRETPGPYGDWTVTDGYLTYRLVDDALDEVSVTLCDTEKVFLRALTARFGAPRELCNASCRINTWTSGGHEVRLERHRDRLACSVECVH